MASRLQPFGARFFGVPASRCLASSACLMTCAASLYFTVEQRHVCFCTGHQRPHSLYLSRRLTTLFPSFRTFCFFETQEPLAFPNLPRAASLIDISALSNTHRSTKQDSLASRASTWRIALVYSIPEQYIHIEFSLTRDRDIHNEPCHLQRHWLQKGADQDPERRASTRHTGHHQWEYLHEVEVRLRFIIQRANSLLS